MNTALRVLLVLVGCVGLFVYFRSIVRMMLLNRRERDVLERIAARFVIVIMHGLASGKRSQSEVKHVQAWLMPMFIFTIVAIWFVLVQFSFGLILWGVRVEPNLGQAFIASGSALSTLGFHTPNTTAGEWLAIGEAAIGLGIVILLFTFVPGYQSAIQARERKGGWLASRTTQTEPSCVGLLRSLQRSGQTDDASVWLEWESWFRGLLETHSISPVLAYVPSIYRGNWVDTATTILDAASLLLVSGDSQHTEGPRLCREAGIAAVRSIAAELIGDREQRQADELSSADANASLLALHDQLHRVGLPVAADEDRWVQSFAALRKDYISDLRHISRATLMPIMEPWERPPPAAQPRAGAKR